MSPQELLKSVENYLKNSGELPTVFSKRVTGDPALVLKMRHGRELRHDLACKIIAAVKQK